MNNNLTVAEPGGHYDQLLRQTRAHHVVLSQQADHKANMLLSLAAVMISILLPQIESPGMRGAGTVLMGFLLATVLMAAYAVMPKISLTRQRRRPDPSSPGFNILFFGDFGRLSYEEFCAEMERALNDPSECYTAMLREIYTLGSYLAKRKYRYVQYAYATFIAGLLAACAMWLATGN